MYLSWTRTWGSLCLRLQSDGFISVTTDLTWKFPSYCIYLFTDVIICCCFGIESQVPEDDLVLVL